MNLHPFNYRLARVIALAGIGATTVLALGCANQPVTTAPLPVVVAPPAPVLPPREFETETLYSLLVAELAGSRDRLDIMLGNYVKQAIDTQDAGVTERAAQLASYMHEPTATLQMASQWASLDANNPQAHYMAMAALTDAGLYFQAFDHGKFLIEQQHSPHGLDALAAKATQKNVAPADVASLHKLYVQLAQSYPRDAFLQLALSFLAFKEQNFDQSLAAARAAQALKPDHEPAYFQELRVLEKQNPQHAQQGLGEIVALFPKNQHARLQYARELASTNLPAAAVQFEELLKQAPEDANIQLALALTYYQQAELDKAKENFLPLLNQKVQANIANYYLGQIANQQNEPLRAITYFTQVGPSKEFLPALARATDLMHKHQQQDQALQLLAGLQLNAEEQYQEGIALLLSDHYKNVGNKPQAERALNEGIKQFPRSLPLLYNRAMFYAGEYRVGAAEQDLQTILAIKPDHAEALNTLGYLLADSNLRLPEALGYVERALALEPENPAAIDSLGWVHYRLGNLNKAIGYLRQALQLFPNDEIAAHLGEVLWANGDKQAALDVWQQGLKLNPGSRYIHERLQRFQLMPSTLKP